MRIEAKTLRSSTMELALVSTGLMGAVDRQNRLLYFDTCPAPAAIDNYMPCYLLFSAHLGQLMYMYRTYLAYMYVIMYTPCCSPPPGATKAMTPSALEQTSLEASPAGGLPER